MAMDRCDDQTDNGDIVQFLKSSSQTSSIVTSVTDGEDFIFDTKAFQNKLTVPTHMKLSMPKEIGKFVKVNERGWIEE